MLFFILKIVFLNQHSSILKPKSITKYLERSNLLRCKKNYLKNNLLINLIIIS